MRSSTERRREQHPPWSPPPCEARLSRKAEPTGAASQHDAPEKARQGAAYMAESALLLARSGFLASGRCVAEPE